MNPEGRQIPEDCIWDKHPTPTATSVPQLCASKYAGMRVCQQNYSLDVVTLSVKSFSFLKTHQGVSILSFHLQ